jgi:putative endonuclease
MRDADTLVFVEVRQRAANALVSAIESISPAKVRKIRRTATLFLIQNATLPDVGETDSRRFDVVAIDGDLSAANFNLEWRQDAF